MTQVRGAYRMAPAIDPDPHGGRLRWAKAAHGIVRQPRQGRLKHSSPPLPRCRKLPRRHRAPHQAAQDPRWYPR